MNKNFNRIEGVSPTLSEIREMVNSLLKASWELIKLYKKGVIDAECSLISEKTSDRIRDLSNKLTLPYDKVREDLLENGMDIVGSGGDFSEDELILIALGSYNKVLNEID